MIDKIPVKKELGFVIIGNFNPEIYQPKWLAALNFLGVEETNASDIIIISKDVTIFTTSGISFEILRDRFCVRVTEDRYYEPMRDLVNNIFSRFTTPTFMMGVNTNSYFNINDKKHWYKISKVIAPKNILSEIEELKDPELGNLVINAKRYDNYEGSINVNVGLSRAVKPSSLCLYIGINDHFIFNKDGIDGGMYVSTLLRAEWETLLERFKKITDKILGSLNE